MDSRGAVFNSIKARKFFVVEGADDVGFFCKLLDKVGVTDYYCRGIGGKNNFNKELPVLAKVTGFDKLTHFCIIRDQDQDNAFESVAKVMHDKMNIQSIPARHGTIAKGTPSVGIFICPGDSIKGTCLEDLCLEIVREHPAMHCVNYFVDCLSRLESKPQNLSKAKTLSFLAAQPKIVNTIGLGALKGYWDFTSPALHELVHFLELFK